MENSSVMLLRRLNPFCANALEAAASLCQTRAHAEVTIEHWLPQAAWARKVISLPEGAPLWMDISALLAKPKQWNRQPTLTIHSRHPLKITPKLNSKRMGDCAFPDEDIEHIRSSVHILAAMVKQPSLVPNDALWPINDFKHHTITTLKTDAWCAIRWTPWSSATCGA